MKKLELLNLTKSFSSFKALSNVSIELLSGETHALMGENGAGKTTLIKVLAGILKPDQMIMKIDNNIQNIYSSIQSKNLGFNFIHQELNIVSYLSVAENMFLNHPYPKKYKTIIDWNKIYKLSSKALEELGVTHIDVKKKCAKLSTGDQMLVKIASCLIKTDTTPTLYVFDEPTAALTLQESEKLFKVINNLKKRGAIILYVSHRMNEILEISDKVTVLRDGIKVLTEKTSELSKEKIIRSMVGKDLSDNFPQRTGNINENIVIDVNNVHTKNIKNINFKIKAGEVLGIAGLSNSGQREIFNMLMGVDNIAKGKISFMDQKYEPTSPSDAWKKLISFVPRERRKEALMLKMSVKSNTTTPHYSKLSKFFFLANKQEENLITNNYSKKVQLKYNNINQSIYQLSGGNQQKVVFSRALASNPKLLLLDEPTRGVDVGAKLDIYNLIIQLTKNGCGIVLNSSDLSEIMGMCDKILILKDHEQYKILENFKINSQDVLANFYESKKQ